MEQVSVMVQNRMLESYTTSDINGNHKVIDMRECPETSVIFNNEPEQKEIDNLNKWLRTHKEEYVVLYHGTSAEFPIKEQGLKKTTYRTKKSYQSEPGYVYLSLFPGSAKFFGEIAYPNKEIAVYPVCIKIKELKPDYDQLVNKKMAGFDAGDTLADSLIYGHGARVKRHINPWEIKEPIEC